MQGGQQEKLFGHPCGLYTLFFAEMWERFSYYGMRALLVFYMIKGFLGYNDGTAYAVYGAYTALVYMTPFFGGMLADRLIGQRRAVVLGGLLMAAGHLMMTFQTSMAFFVALGLLIAGNGFFKPNISTMVGTLYPEGSPKRDGGFTIFYMGVNLGASMAPLLCGYIGETYGWHKGFGLATIGMLAGVAVFVAPVRITQILIMAGAIAGAIALFMFRPDNMWSIGLNVFVALALLASGVISWIALSRGGLPQEAGAPPDPERLRAPAFAGISAEWSVYLGTLILVPVFALFVSGFSPFTSDGEAVRLISKSVTEDLEASENAFVQIFAVVVGEVSKPAGLVLTIAGLTALIYLLRQTFRLDRIRRERMFVVLILTFFSILFWSFFEQAGSSINNFTDRNVDRVSTDRVISDADVGQEIQLQPTQLQLGFTNGKAVTFVDPSSNKTVHFGQEKFEGEEPAIETLNLAYDAREQLFTLDVLDKLRDFYSKERGDQEPQADFQITWLVTADNVGMRTASRVDEVPASTFQSINAICILIFGLVFTALWGYLASRKLEPSTPFKFAAGLLQLALGFVALWYGAQNADERGMVGVVWLILGYLLHTTGELCLSPVGLSMVTKLSPKILVSTVMGNWFLATAFSQYLAAIISQFTGVSHGGGDESAGIPVPKDTVHVYGDVFGQIAVAGIISSVVCFLLVPILKKWMHEGEEAPGES